MKSTFFVYCMMYNQERKTVCRGFGKTRVNPDNTLILKSVMEHCPTKVSKVSLEWNAFMKLT